MGYQVLFEIKKSKIKKEIALLSRDQKVILTVITLEEITQDPGFRRIGKDEFMFRGKLYDVVYKKRLNQTVYFYCIHDTKEEQLAAGFRKLVGDKMVQSVLDHLIKIAVPVAINGTRFGVSPPVAMYPPVTTTLTTVYLSVWSPPPKISTATFRPTELHPVSNPG